MCRTTLVLTVALWATTGARVAAQWDARRLREVEDSLALEWRDAVAAAARADSVARSRAQEGRDTLRVEGLLFLVPRDAAVARLRAAAVTVWALFDAMYGDAARGLVSRPLVVDVASTPQPGERGTDVAFPADASTEEITRLLADRVPRIHGFGADGALREWVGGVLGPAPDSRIAPSGLYLQVVTAPSRVARQCFGGSVPACRAALGLDAAGDPVVARYDAAERLDIARGNRYYLNRHPHHDLFTACASETRDVACIELLRTLPPEMLPLPVSGAGRLALARLALRIGGRDAYGRLLARPRDPLSDRLAAAAGVSVDSLVGRWHAEVLAARPHPVTVSGGRILIALLWAGVFVICGLRSSKWRAT